MEWEWHPDTAELTACYTPAHSAEKLNARVLAILLEEKVGILEIRRGSDLETEYLNASIP